MAIFNKTKSHLGIDIGTDSVKVIELQQADKPTLVTYGVAEDSIDVVRDTSAESTKKIVGVIEQIKDKARISGTSAIAALPSFAVFSSILSLPAMPKKDLAQAVKWEAKKFVPMPLEEMILDWKLLKSIDELQHSRNANGSPVGGSQSPQSQPTNETKNQTNQNTISAPAPGQSGDISITEAAQQQEATLSQDGSEGSTQQQEIPKKPSGHLRVLITAAPKNLVSRYVDIFKSAGLQLTSLETEAFAVARSLIGKQHGSIMVVDIGSITTDIMIIEDSIPILNRSIDVGGKTLTQAIAQGLHIDPARAEQFKRDIGINQSAGSSIPRVVEQTMQPVLQEITYSNNLYSNQTGQSIEKIILTGGSAFLPAMDLYLAQATNINTYIGDPWSQIVYPAELRPVLDEVGARLAVAIGLALRPMVK